MCFLEKIQRQLDDLRMKSKLVIHRWTQLRLMLEPTNKLAVVWLDMLQLQVDKLTGNHQPLLRTLTHLR